MKINETGFLLVSIMTLLLLIPAQAKAESFNEMALPTGSLMNLQNSDPELPRLLQSPRGFNFNSVEATLSKEEAETFLFELGIDVKEKQKTRGWDPFKAARVLMTSA